MLMRAAALLLIASAGCKPALVPGAYVCNPNDPTPCPPGWYCQIREMHDYRCYDVDGPHCGDGMVTHSVERCDPDDHTVPCSVLRYYGDGMLGCSADCTTYDTRNCTGGYCGDGVINRADEECDGLEPNADSFGDSCSGLGFFGGALGCSSNCKRTYDTCIGPWQVAFTSPSSYLFDVWFTSPEEGFAVGSGGTILHYQSSHWSSEVAPARDFPYDLYDVWGDTADNVYAVGTSINPSDRDVIFHYQNHAWSPLFVSPAAGLEGLTGVWGSGHGDVYFSGWEGFFRYDESNPSQLPSVVYSTGPHGVNGFLLSVWGRGANDVYAVGTPDPLTYNRGRIVHWNGTEARVVHDEPNSIFVGVWSTMDVGDPIYAVGAGGLFRSWDGLNWNPVLLHPPIEGDPYGCIWGTSASDVFASFSNQDGARVYHFDGANWVATPFGRIPHANVFGLGGSPDAVWAVGATGDPYNEITAAVIWRYSSDPPRWVAMASPTSSDLHAITGTAGGDLFAVGAKGTLLRFHGNDWAPWTSQTENDLYAAWSPGSDAVFAAGTQTLLRCNAGSCNAETRLPRDASQLGTFWALWGSSMDNVFASASQDPLDSTLWHLSGDGWTEWTFYLAGTRFRGLWGYDREGVLAVGTNLSETGATGAIAVRQYMPGAVPWAYRDPMLPMPDSIGELTAVWGTSKSHVFAVASDGRILHHDGATWQVMSQPQTQPLNGIWGRSATDVYAVGNGGSVQHYDGASWTPMDSGTNATLNGVWVDASGVYAVGDGGLIIHLADQLPALTGGNCPRPVPLYCGAPTPYFGDTKDAVSTFESYGCPTRKLTGGEVYYRLDSPITGHIVAHLTHAADLDLDLLVLGADGDGGCAPMDCRAASQSMGATETQVEVSVKNDQTYYLVVDGVNGASAGYTLRLECTPG